MFQYTEYDSDVKKAEWAAISTGINKLTIEKLTPDYKPGDAIKKTVIVEDFPGCAYKLMKTKIKADGGVEGLLYFMESHKDFMDVCVKRILNHAWDNMKGV